MLFAFHNGHYCQFKSNVQLEILARILCTKVQDVISYFQRFQEDIESLVDCGRKYPCRDVSEVRSFTLSVKDISSGSAISNTGDRKCSKFWINSPSSSTDFGGHPVNECIRCSSQLFDRQVPWALSAYIRRVEIHGVDYRKKQGLTFRHRACAPCRTATKGPSQEP